MRVAITGASGFIGSGLSRAFRAAGHDVTPLSRSHGFQLGQKLNVTCDVLVHCAHEWRSPSKTFNVETSKKLFEEARANGFSQIVLISSLAARSASHSNYGREKRAIESFLDQTVDIVIRPGLVVGDGGLFGSMTQAIKTIGIVPIFDGGRQPVYTVGIDDLTRAIVTIVERKRHGTYELASAAPVPMRDVLALIAQAERRRIRLVPLPYRFVLALVSTLERANIRLPITSESLRGLQNLVEFDVRSNDDELGLQLRPLHELLGGA